MLNTNSIFDIGKIHSTCKISTTIEHNVSVTAKPVQFVGQEQDATLLFTWEDCAPGLQDGNLVTYIGTYNPYKNSIHAVFVHNQKTNIVNATINKSNTFLGFVSHEFVDRTGPQGKQQQQGVYKAYIAEIQPQNRVFYLNLERENYMKLQFVYGAQRSYGNSTGSSREDHLLVILHKESIGLYHIPLARVGEEGVIMSGEPRKEQLFHRRFVWVEWDSTYQRLYIVHFLKSGKSDRGKTIHQPYFKCYQFLQQDPSNYAHRKDKELVLDMPLDLPIPYLKDSVYLSVAPYPGIPDSAINMQVLSLPNGELCLCYQHPNNKTVKTDISGPTTIQYSIYLLHKDSVIQCECRNIPHHALVNGRLFFSWIDGYLLVYLPGYLTHLLCVGVEYDPGMHIIYADSGGIDTEHLIPFPSDKINVANAGMCFYNVNLHEAFRFSLDGNSLLQLFEKSDQLATKMYVLHYATAQTNDLNLVKQIIQCVTKSPTSLDTVPLLKELLIGNTYTQLRRQVFAIEKKMLTYLPYTSEECGKKQTCILPDGTIQSIISYSSLPEVTILAEKHSANNFWLLLAKHYSALKSTPNCRFDLNFAKTEANFVEQTTEKVTITSNNDQENPSLFKKLSAGVRGAFTRDNNKQPISPSIPPPRLVRSQSKTDMVLGSPPTFLNNKDDDSFYKTSRYFSKTVELLSVHLIKYHRHDSRTKMRSIAEEYVKCQMLASRLLCHIIWNVMTTPGKLEEVNLSKQGTKKEVELVMMLERYIVAAEQLGFPLPSGVKEYMIRLGFRCSELHKFLQYVDQGVYDLTPQFVLQVIEDLPDTPKNVQTKWLLLQQLPQDSMCLAHWDHPSALQCVGQQYSEMVITKQIGWETLFKQNKPGTGVHAIPHEHTNEHDTFPPAITFVKYLQKKDYGLQQAEGSTGVELDTDYLRRAAMAYMSTATSAQ